MEINGPPLPQLNARQAPSAIGAWKIGQIFQAVVVRQHTPQSVILQVNQQQLEAETKVPLSTGQRLELNVIQLGDKPVLQARLLTSPASPQNTPTPPPPVSSATTPVNSSGTQSTSATPAGSATLAPQTSTPSNSVQPQANQLMKLALPKQASMTSLLANVAWLNNPATQLPPLPSPVLMIIKQLYNNLPTKEKLTNATEIKQGMLNSGIFMENKLKKIARPEAKERSSQTMQQSLSAPSNSTQAGADLKSTLLRLLNVIQSVKRTTPTQTAQGQPVLQSQITNTALPFTPPTLRGSPPQPQQRMEANLPAALGNLQLLLLELGKQSEATLARTQLHQVASMPGGEQTSQSMAFELPIRNNQQIDVFDIVIEQEKQHEHDDEEHNHAWSINLAFDLDGLGPLHARLKLVDNKVSSLFWAEREETTALLNQHIANLSERYRQAGLEATELHCFSGTPPNTSTAMPHIVLDVKA